MWKSHKYLVLAAALLATTAAHFTRPGSELLAVLRSDATLQEKSAACRQLARIATKEAVPTLAALLGDEKLSHMARYALEPIRDPSVDDALRDALGKVQGQPAAGRDRQSRRETRCQSRGCAGRTARGDRRRSGRRPRAGQYRHTRRRESLGGRAARRVGRQPTGHLRRPAPLRRGIGSGRRKCSLSRAIYDRLRGLADAPPQVRAAALRGAILARGKDGVPLLVEAIGGSDYALAAAAVRAAMERPARRLPTRSWPNCPRRRQSGRGLLILALADRGELPSLAGRAPGSAEQRRAASHPRVPRLEARRRRLVCPRAARCGGRG